jgi:anti-anti-sigma factor
MAGQLPMAIEWHGDVAVVRIEEPALADLPAVERLGDDLCRLVASRATPRLIMDLRQARHVSSAALSMLVRVRRKIQDAEGKLAVCLAGGEVRSVFTVTGLEPLFAFAPTPEEGLPLVGGPHP